MSRDKEKDLGVVARFWPPLEEAEIGRLLDRYEGLGQSVEIVGHSSRPLSSAALVRSEAGEVFVKRRSRRSRTTEMLAQEHAFIDHLRVRGIGTPEVLASRDGSTFLVEGEFLYEVQTKAEGEDVYADRHTWQPFLSSSHAEDVGRTMRHLRDASTGYAPEPPAEPGIQSGRFALAAEGLDGVRRWFAAHPRVETLFRQSPAAEGLDVFAPFIEVVGPWLRTAERQMMHGDPQANNFLYSGGEVASVIDFHLCAVNPPLFDLAVAIDRNGLLWLDILASDDDAVDWPGIEGLLRGYGPLDPDERAVLPALVAVVQLDFALELAEYYLEVEGSFARANWCFEAFLVGHTAWHASEAGRAFAVRLETLVV